MIELATLGRCGIFRDGVELTTLASQKQKTALLVYVAAEGPVPRDRLLSLFWPERDRERASHSLSQALYSLRRDLGEECVSLPGDSTEISVTCRLDALELESAAKWQDWERSVELYQGPFLDQFTLPGAPDFEEWAYRRRTRHAGQARRAFRSVIEAKLQAGEREAALAVAARWARLEPLEDEAQHVYIVLLAQSGDRTSALQHYNSYCDGLATELDVQPLEEMKALVGAVRAGKAVELPPLRATDAGVAADAGATAGTGPATKRPAQASDEADLAAGVPAETATEMPHRGWQAFWTEWRARPVVQVGLVYLGAAWIALQLTEILQEGQVLPPSAVKVVLALLAALLPVALVLVWVREQRGAIARPDRVSWLSRFREVGSRYLLHALVGLALLLAAGYVAAKRFITPPLELAQQDERVAVMPFTDLTTGGQLKAFVDGLPEVLTHALTQIDPLWVQSAAALRRFRDMELTTAIADSLDVDVIVRGAVFGNRERVRVTVQLIEAETFKTAESAQIEGVPPETPDSVASELTDSIAGLLRGWLGSRQDLRELRARTRSERAWDLFVRGRTERRDAIKVAGAGDVAGAQRLLVRADRFLEDAERADRSWLDPIVERGWVATRQARLAADEGRRYDPHWTRIGLEHVNRALAKNPRYAPALELGGVLLDYLVAESDPPEADSLAREAERMLRQATEEDERRALAWTRLTRILRNQGRLNEAMIAAQHAYEADAFQLDAPVVLFRLCRISIEIRDWESVTKWCGEGHARFPKRAPFVSLQLTALAGPEGPEPDPALAWQLAETQLSLQAPQQRPKDRPSTLMAVAAVLARAGLADSARAVIRRARAADDGQNPKTLIWEANARLRLGESDEAIRLLAEYFRARPGERQKVATDWWWDGLRNHPNFQSLIAEPTE